MSGTVAAIWRHPLKGHGREALDAVTLHSGAALPWDRVWAVVHEAAKLEGDGWAPCQNFTRGAKATTLMAITVRLDETREHLTLTHPERPDLTFDPETEADAFLDWVAPLMPEGRARPVRLLRAQGQALTDSPFPSVSLCNTASLAALSDRAGLPLSRDRFRANFWLDGLSPWQEFDWVGQTIILGGARLAVRERIARCVATTANPLTGRSDVDTLALLSKTWGHTDFGIYAEVIDGGPVAIGDHASPV